MGGALDSQETHQEMHILTRREHLPFRPWDSNKDQ